MDKSQIVAMFNHLKAAEMGLDSCFAWGVLESERMFPENAHNDLLDLPEDFEPPTQKEGFCFSEPFESIYN